MPVFNLEIQFDDKGEMPPSLPSSAWKLRLTTRRRQTATNRGGVTQK
ncbi:MAG: hypothetical protein LBB60_04510 [Desulfovibrio sp.]|jgi:hypothetical protein|nr:hypothetical protein [Desulfovibrio sp.]